LRSASSSEDRFRGRLIVSEDGNQVQTGERRLAAPRLYLHRKAGRSVWDAEFWLPDGRRKTWRTGLTDRAEAERIAKDRLETMARTLNAAHLEPAEAEAHVTAHALTNEDPEADHSVPPQRKGDGDWLQRLDAWFFGDLRTAFLRDARK
jgi:hypothetical protein